MQEHVRLNTYIVRYVLLNIYGVIYVNLNMYILTYVRLNMYVVICVHLNINIRISSSSSCCAASTDIRDPLSPLLPIIHRLWLVFRARSHFLTELFNVCSSWSSWFCLAICGGPQEYITYELVLASPAVSCMSGSASLDSFRDGRQVAV